MMKKIKVSVSDGKFIIGCVAFYPDNYRILSRAQEQRRYFGNEPFIGLDWYFLDLGFNLVSMQSKFKQCDCD